MAVVVVIYLPLIFHAPPSQPAVGAHHKQAQSQISQAPSTQTDSTDSSLLSKFSMDNIFPYSQFSEMIMNTSLEVDTYLNSLCEASIREEPGLEYHSVTLIFSILNIISDTEAILFIRHHLQMVPSSFTEDVIITAEANLSKTIKDSIEEFVDFCQVCRLLFLSGNIYKHWNDASKFARSKYLVFVDARVSFTKNSLQTMIKCLRSEENTVVSPQLHLKFADGRGNNVGLSRNEITWDLGVSRVAVSYQLLQTAKQSGDSCVNQTVIAKEVFGIRKKFFADLKGFDIIPGITGGEHVSFSLKVLNCHGNIVTSLCSEAHLSVGNTAEKPDLVKSSGSSAVVDFQNPTFHASRTNISTYYIAASKTWLDIFTSKYYYCSLMRIPAADLTETYAGKRNKSAQTSMSHRHGFDLNRYLNTQYSHYGYSLKQALIKSKCQVSNFRYIVSQRQPQMLPPTKSATFYGYIRTLDGLHAFGQSTETPAAKSELHKQHSPTETLNTFILTRNTSLWVGPFSFTNGAFIYNNIWCLTVSTRFTLTLQKCAKGEENQLFGFSNNIITHLGISARCVGAKRSKNISSDILVSSCIEHNRLIQFKLDIEFTEKCVK